MKYLANANSEIETLHEEISKKNEESCKQQEEVMRLSYEMREVHRRLTELKKENDELKVLLSLTGQTRHEYETRVSFRSMFMLVEIIIDNSSVNLD